MYHSAVEKRREKRRATATLTVLTNLYACVHFHQVDIYSLGNIFYLLLNQNYPWREQYWRHAAKLVLDGKRPPVIQEVWENADKDPALKALIQAMVMCQDQAPEDRATALEVLEYLQDQLEKIDPGRLEAWGVHLSTPARKRF